LACDYYNEKVDEFLGFPLESIFLPPELKVSKSKSKEKVTIGEKQLVYTIGYFLFCLGKKLEKPEPLVTELIENSMSELEKRLGLDEFLEKIHMDLLFPN
jgi:hypothetical protein